PAGSQHLSVTLDGSELFWFDFPRSRWVPAGIRAGNAARPWPGGRETPRQVLEEAQLCREILEGLGKALEGVVPEVRGTPTVSIFPIFPPILGEPNALLCHVENIFPPDVEITWLRSGVSVGAGSSRTPFVPTAELTFRRSSAISVTPRLGEVHACVVTSWRDNASVVAYW
ncbi:DMA protein, partial [Origma solitaria]|nr:DMA protein [Origma solitaria]